MKNRMSALVASPFLIFSLILFSLISSKLLFAQNIKAVDVIPDQEKRSCIQTVDGYAYLSENMTLAETRTTAFATAKRQALEAARTYIQSKTKVKNFQVEYDLIWSDAEGSVTILEQKDHGVEENSRYHVWIKAEVIYDFKPKKFGPLHAGIIDEDAPLTVKVWTDKKDYAMGENIQIYIQGNRDFYARIVNITSNGEIIQLLPNDYRGINFFEAGNVYKIPDQEDRFDLRVTAPYGEDQIVVYASEVPLGKVAMEPVGHGLNSYRGSRKSLATMTRGINVVPGSLGSHSGAEFYEATWTLTTSQ